MDLDAINQWFSEHPDAILVTDKVNDPEAIVPLFVDKSRLMMELFSEKAVTQAQALGIRSALPSMNVIYNKKGDKLEYLQSLKVSGIAVSVNLIHEDPGLYARIKAAGIKTYVFHVNGKPWINEKHVVLHEMDYCYGMYADHWRFWLGFRLICFH